VRLQEVVKLPERVAINNEQSTRSRRTARGKAAEQEAT
jgi:hypothetical protein